MFFLIVLVGRRYITRRSLGFLDKGVKIQYYFHYVQNIQLYLGPSFLNLK